VRKIRGSGNYASKYGSSIKSLMEKSVYFVGSYYICISRCTVQNGWSWAVLPLNTGPSPDDSSSQPAHGTVTILFFSFKQLPTQKNYICKKGGFKQPHQYSNVTAYIITNVMAQFLLLVCDVMDSYSFRVPS
jgi:hypothetical protein